MHLKLFEFGGLFWLRAPFVLILLVASWGAEPDLVAYGSATKSQQSLALYLFQLGCSVVYFFVVTYVLLRDWNGSFELGARIHKFTTEPLEGRTGSIEELGEIYADMERAGYTHSEIVEIMKNLSSEMSETFVELAELVWPDFSDSYDSDLSIGGWSSISFGVDGLSLCLIILTAFIVPTGIFYCWRNVADRLAVVNYLLVRELLLVVAFWTRDLLVFFICFELVMWPMYRLIIVWGAHEQKKKASMSFILYTVFGSRILLVVILVLLSSFGTTSIDYIASALPEQAWWSSILWFPTFIAFAVKVPSFPFHHWLTLAHVEAPTVGSIILAALLLKLGSYGFLRFMLPVFSNPDAFQLWMPIAATLMLLSIIFAALMAISQTDLKRIVAYSSIAHMNFSLLGLMSLTDRAVVGGTILFIAHGFVSAGMFFSVGFLYDRYHQRDLLYFRGLTTVAPLFSFFFFLFNLANLGVPRSFNFLGEFLIFAELINIYHFAAPRLILALIVQVGYTMKLISILFGEVVYTPQSVGRIWSDLSINEVVIALLLLAPVWWFGVNGSNIMSFMTQINLLTDHLAPITWTTSYDVLVDYVNSLAPEWCELSESCNLLGVDYDAQTAVQFLNDLDNYFNSVSYIDNFFLQDMEYSDYVESLEMQKILDQAKFRKVPQFCGVEGKCVADFAKKV